MPKRRKNRWAYHVTFARNLEGISIVGLDPRSACGISDMGHAGHSCGKTFLSNYEDIQNWYWEAEQAAETQSDNFRK